MTAALLRIVVATALLLAPLRAVTAIDAIDAIGAIGTTGAIPTAAAGPTSRSAPLDPRAALVRAEKLFDDQEYDAVIAVLTPVTRDANATRAQRLRALELIGLSQLILDDEPAARDAFVRLLSLDPDYQLRDPSGSPRIAKFFDAVKRDVVPGFGDTDVAELDHTAPPTATAGRRLELEVTVTTGRDQVKDLVLRHRARGTLDYRSTPMSPRGESRYRAAITPEPSQSRYTLEYYIEAHDIVGAAIARVAGPESPLSIEITPGGERTSKRRWLYIAGGALLIGLGAALVITAARGPDEGTLPPGTVTVTP